VEPDPEAPDTSFTEAAALAEVEPPAGAPYAYGSEETVEVGAADVEDAFDVAAAALVDEPEAPAGAPYS
jgi:hypothetical protein